MSFLGNLIWIVFGGLFMAIGYLLLGVVYCITIIGIPVGLQLFKMAGLSFCPFGRDVIDRNGQMGCWSLFLNILWIVFGGVESLLNRGFGILRKLVVPVSEYVYLNIVIVKLL